MENNENYIKQASDLVGSEEIANLEKEIDESARYDFQKLLTRFKLAPEEGEEESPKMPENPKTQIREKAKVEKDPVKALEKSLKAKSRSVSLYYELFELHRKNSNFKAAKKHLKTWSRRIRVRSMASIYWER